MGSSSKRDRGRSSGKNGHAVNHKRDKLYNSRIIRNELNDPAFTNPDGRNHKIITLNNMANKLDVPTLVKSRKFEIQSLEKSQLKSKYASSTRVFQSLPRELRRRTASHNVKRVPKRMRPRALKEMGLSNRTLARETKGVSTSGKPLHKSHPRGRELYRLRRKQKLLKYAAKHKLSGQVLHGEIVDIKKMDMRGKLKMIKQEIQKIESERKLQEDEIMQDKHSDESTMLRYDISATKKAKNLVNNLAGSYDNTGVNAKASIHRISALKYATRQAKFKWLPTHIWHAKRAKMIKRWGWQIPYEPTMKCFRKTSRSYRFKGCLAWDTSYINTFILNCSRNSNESVKVVVKILLDLSDGAINETSTYLSGKRLWEGFIHLGSEPVSPGSIHVIFSDKLLQVVIRVHPSTYNDVYDRLNRAIAGNDNIDLHDAKYAVGSIKVTGPKALEALQSIFHNRRESSGKAYELWRSLANLHDVNTIPKGSMFAFMVEDPRMWNKPVIAHASLEENADDILNLILKVKQNGGIDQEALQCLLSIDGRNSSYKNQQTLKQLGKRRKPEISGEPIPRTNQDPMFPVVIWKDNDNSFNVILPWFWTMPVWYQLVHVPHLMMAGTRQLDQIDYERGHLSFSDLVFTRNGYTESRIRMEENTKRWNRKPKSKRIQYDSLQLGNETGELLSPFGCDWRSLQVLRFALQKVPKDADNSNIVPSEFDKFLSRIIMTNFDAIESVKDIQKHDKSIFLTGKRPYTKIPMKLVAAKELATLTSSFEFTSKGIPQLPVKALSFECTNRGNITDGARIYIIPQDHVKQWVLFGDSTIKNIKGGNMSSSNLQVPGSEYLIGLVTSATFNLSKGYGTGVGYVDASALTTCSKYILIRNIGSDVCRVCKWKFINVL